LNHFDPVERIQTVWHCSQAPPVGDPASPVSGGNAPMPCRLPPVARLAGSPPPPTSSSIAWHPHNRTPLHRPPHLNSIGSQLPRLLTTLQVRPKSTAAHRNSPAASNRRQVVARSPLASTSRHGVSHHPKPCPLHPPSFSCPVATGASTPHRTTRRRCLHSCPTTVHRVFRFLISFKIPENMYTLLKQIENGIKLGKIQNKFL
jgi:hypothetical protein